MKHKCIVSVLFMLCFLIKGEAFNFNKQLKKGPILIINKNTNGVFDSVTAIAVINAPYQKVWDTIVDINSYKKYMPQVVESKITKVMNGNEIIFSRFEIEVPLSNTKYTLKHYLDYTKKKIDVYQVAGDLKGSHWHWKFETRRDKTMVQYTGKTINYSSILQSFEDTNKTISMGINIASVLETIRLIKKQAEL